MGRPRYDQHLVFRAAGRFERQRSNHVFSPIHLRAGIVDVIVVRSVFTRRVQYVGAGQYGHGLRSFQVVKAVFRGYDGGHIGFDRDRVDQLQPLDRFDPVK